MTDPQDEATQDASGTIISTDPTLDAQTNPESLESASSDADTTTDDSAPLTATETTESSTGVEPDGDPIASTVATEPAPFGAADTDSATTASDGSTDAGSVSEGEALPQPEASSDDGVTDAFTPGEDVPVDSPDADVLDVAPEEAEAGPTPAPDVDSSDAEDSDTDTFPESDGSNGDSEEEPTPDETPANSAGTADPTGTGTGLGKDGAGPTSSLPQLGIEDSDGDVVTPGPGVDPDVSLSPTATGGYTSDDEEEVDDTPVLSTPADETTVEPTFANQPDVETETIGRTTSFVGYRRSGYYAVSNRDYIGQDPLMIGLDEIDEVISLLQRLSAGE